MTVAKSAVGQDYVKKLLFNLLKKSLHKVYIAAGFSIEKMLEPIPTQETIARDKSWEKDLHKPNFLLIKAMK